MPYKMREGEEQNHENIQVTIRQGTKLISKREYVERKQTELLNMGFKSVSQEKIERELNAILRGRTLKDGLTAVGVCILNDSPTINEE